MAVWSDTSLTPGSCFAICSTFCCVAASFTVPFIVTLPSLAVTLTAASLVAGSAATLLCTSAALFASLALLELEHPKASPSSSTLERSLLTISFDNVLIEPPELTRSARTVQLYRFIEAHHKMQHPAAVFVKRLLTSPVPAFWSPRPWVRKVWWLLWYAPIRLDDQPRTRVEAGDRDAKTVVTSTASCAHS